MNRTIFNTFFLLFFLLIKMLVTCDYNFCYQVVVVLISEVDKC